MKENKYINRLMLVVLVVFFTIVFSNRNNTIEMEIVNKDFYSINNPLNNPIELMDYNEHLHLSLIDEGFDVYDCGGHSGYRYGPSIIYYDGGTYDVFFSSPGNNIQWDYIRYRHYDGNDWSADQVVLSPTINSNDHYSTCDPGLIYFDGYYYLGYTSTSNPNNGGIYNCVFVARATDPEGPYEKWSGDGWGNNPVPILSYTGDVLDPWGAGEVSFVVKDDKLYCYYSYIDGPDHEYLAIGDLCENWPETLKIVGPVITKGNGQDSLDFAYIDEYEKFIAVSVEQRFSNCCSIAVYESSDGITFNKCQNLKKNLVQYAHNIGISKDLYGHIDPNRELIIGYAYGPHSSWGRWNTRFHYIEIENRDN